MIPLGVIQQQAVSAGLSCTYPLDALEAEIQSLHANRAAMSDSDQTASATTFGSAYHDWGAFQTGFLAGTTAQRFPITGKWAFELQPTVPAAVDVAGTADVLGSKFELYNIPPGNAIFAAIINARNNGLFKIQIFLNGAAVLVINDTASKPATIGAEFDSSTGLAKVYFDNVKQVLSSYAYPVVAGSPRIVLDQGAAKNAGDNGKILSMKMITNAAQMTTTFSAGTTDICGTVI